MLSRDAAQAVLVFLLYAVACSLSYLKSDLTANDFERFDDLRLTTAYFVLLLLLCASYLSRVARAGAVAPAFRWGVWAACLLPLLFMFPVGSKDVFMYSFHARIWGHYGANPYLQPSSSFAGDDWLRFLNVWWVDHPFPYGPLALEQARAIYALAGSRLAAMVAGFKLCNAALLLPGAWLIGDLAARSVVAPSGGGAARDRAMMLWLWCPLVLFDGVGNAHNDVTMTVLILAAVALHVRDRWLLSLVLLALAFWFKWYSVVLLPVWLARQWRRHPQWLSARHAALAAAICGALTALVILPFTGSLWALGERVFANQNIFRVFPNELPPPLWLFERVGRWTGVTTGPHGTTIFNVARLGVFAACLGWIVWRRRGQATSARAYLEDCVWSLLAFFSFAVAILWPWHLLAVVALSLASGERRLEWAAAILTTAGLLSYFLTFTIAFAMLGLIAAALWALRRSGASAAPRVAPG